MTLYQAPLRILAVDDDPISREILQDHLSAGGHDVFCAESATQAMYTLEHAPVHIVVADWVMPEVSGLDLCRWVRGRQLPRSPHFVICTVQNERDRLVEAFEAGADDFLTKPFHEAELMARLRAWTRLVTLQEELAARHRESTRLASELIAANRRLSDLATRDELTGLGNRREGMRRVDELVAVSARYGQPLSCASIDIDHFKQFNDSHGHAAGDAVLRHVAATLRQTTRAADLCFRIGGDEFLVLLPQLSLADAASWAERFRSAIADQPYHHNALRLDLGVSVGLAERAAPAGTAGGLLDAADAALYAAKRAGRNTTRRSA
jgi:diguanylate cyclase (GGDEF)-like protein